MAGSVPEFWQLVEQSRLLARDQCQQLDQEFHNTNGSTDHSSQRALADWLVSRNIFSRYQVTVLLAGRPGPFVYGDYKIYDRVESGRLANEFRAVHSGCGHPVLLKFLTGPVVQDQRLWTTAATEAQIACSLSHHALQRFFELVDLGTFKFLVGEDLHGETLAERLAVGRVPLHEACRVTRLVAQGLAALHATGRPHGDVRPLNVWLEAPAPQHPGEVKLLRDPLTPPSPPNFAAEDPQGWLLAQCDYLAPEFQMPGKSPDVLTDLYALGCTLYHMLAGHPPFPGGSTMQKMARHASEAIRPLESYGVPQPLAQLVTFLMAKNPSLRYQDAKTVADQLTAFVDPSVVHLSSPPPLPTLPAYEAALRQSQAQLASRAVQSTFGVPGPAAAPEPEAAAPVVRTEVPVGTVPVGKPVASTAPASGPAFSLRHASESQEVIAPKPLDPALVAAKEARERKKLITILLSVGAAAIALIIGLNMMKGKNNEQVNKPENVEEPDVPELDDDIGMQSAIPSDTKPKIKLPDDFQPSTTPEPKPITVETSVATEAGPRFEVVADDGKLPWASPTSGKAVLLKYVPPVAGISIIVRPSDLLASPEGPKVLKALGPKLEAATETWEKASGVKFADCEQLIVSLHDNNNQFPKVSVVAHLKAPVDPSDLAANWGGATARKEEGKEFYEGTAWSYYVPSGENGRILVMAAAEDIKEIVKEPDPLRKREVMQVLRNTDGARHVNVLFDPTFLFSGEGDPLFAGDFSRVKEPLKWLLGDGLQCGAISMHFDAAFYWELRVQTKVDKPPQDLAAEFRKRLEQVPGNLEDYFAGPLDAPQYWKKLANRLPGMIRELHDETRVAAEGNQAVVNAVLPGAAAHNLVLGTELAIATAPGAGSTTVGTAAYKGPKTLEEAMSQKMKAFSFPSLSLEFALRDFASSVQDDLKGAPFEFSIRIIGKDLEQLGITRNQTVRDFDQKDKTVAETLTALTTKADQRLVWVIAEDPDDKKQKILITTRDGAAKRGNKLPAVFEMK